MPSIIARGSTARDRGRAQGFGGGAGSAPAFPVKRAPISRSGPQGPPATASGRTADVPVWDNVTPPQALAWTTGFCKMLY